MKKTEAISILATSVRPREPKDRARYDEAVRMAIEALKCSETPKSSERTAETAQNVKDGDSVFRQAAIDCVTYDVEHTIECLKALPSAQPESTRTFVELVVRYPAPELCAYEEYKGKPYYSIKYIENGEKYVGYSTYNPKVLSQYLKEYFMPPAQPERLKGHWIVWGGMDIPENHGRHKCSLCREFAPVRYEKPLVKEYLSDFCPHCGADMRKERKG